MQKIFKMVLLMCLSFCLLACSSNNEPVITPGDVVATLHSPERQGEKIAVTLHLVFEGKLDEKKTTEYYQKLLPTVNSLIALQSQSWSPPPMASIYDQYLIVDSMKFCDQLKVDLRPLGLPRFGCVITKMVKEKA